MYGIFKILDEKVGIPGNDVVFLYTNGLYFNTEELAYYVRKRTNQQMLGHKNALKKLILKGRKYMPTTFHFLPFDYVMLNSDYFQRFFDLLQRAYRRDIKLKKYLIETLNGRKNNEANINFMLEEIAVGHIIREHLIEFPKTLVVKDKFRLIVYPGPIFKAEIYVWQNKILPHKNPGDLGKYYNASYDPKEKRSYKFDEIIL